jgi:hypothetical protein
VTASLDSTHTPAVFRPALQNITYTSEMLMVIFGAGASFDSSPTYTPGIIPPAFGEGDHGNDHNRPPLAKDLFANRPLFIDAIDAFPQCKTIVPRLRDPEVTEGHASIETRLQEIELESRTYPRGLLELAAVQCYLQRSISECQRRWQTITRGITNYLQLLREIERAHDGNEPVCLVTFNYDTLLEYSLREFQGNFNSVRDYISGTKPFRVFKPHGSVNWAQEVDIDLPRNFSLGSPLGVLQYLIDSVAELRISDRYVLCDPSSMGVADGRPVFPAIAIPVERKQVFQCPKYMLEELVALLPHVDKVMMIGWRATEEHFLDLLKQHLHRGVRMSIVAGDQGDASEVRVRILRTLINNQPICDAESAAGFTMYLRSGRAQEVLKIRFPWQ